MPPRPRTRRLRRLLLGLVLTSALLLGGPNLWILASTSSRISAPDDAPFRPVAIVLGASVYRGGIPSPILEDRLRAAARLYELGKVERILVSGDRDEAREYDEVGPMAAFLVDLGVPQRQIVVDPHGYRTLDSMARAAEAFGIDAATVVTNDFHVPRAVWLGRQHGIDCVGVAAPARHALTTETRLWNTLRESAARCVAVLDVWRGVEPQVEDR